MHKNVLQREVPCMYITITFVATAMIQCLYIIEFLQERVEVKQKQRHFDRPFLSNLFFPNYSAPINPGAPFIVCRVDRVRRSVSVVGTVWLVLCHCQISPSSSQWACRVYQATPKAPSRGQQEEEWRFIQIKQ